MTGGTGDITNLWWIAMAKANGLDPEKDVELLFSGATSARLAALVAGAVDATMLSTPQSFQAVQNGYADLGPVAPFLGEFPMMIWHVNDAGRSAREGIAGVHPRPQQGGALHVRSGAPAGGVADAGGRLEVEPRRRAQDLGRLHAGQGLRGGRRISDTATERVRDTCCVRRHQAIGAARAYVDLASQNRWRSRSSSGPEVIDAGVRHRVRKDGRRLKTAGSTPPRSTATTPRSQPCSKILLEDHTGDVLEIGSGTGQHAVAFASRMPTISLVADRPQRQSSAQHRGLAQPRRSSTTSKHQYGSTPARRTGSSTSAACRRPSR
jgi:hypothetical protein